MPSLTSQIFVGIDVGAARKGYHAVALRDSALHAKFKSADATAIARWCRDVDARIVAVDAPCRWRIHGQPARAAERELAADRISCFSTPTVERARGHAFYTWMFAGQELYTALAPDFPLYTGTLATRARCTVESFPQAVACVLAGEHVSARGKLARRTALLQHAGIDVTALTGIDEIDATLCALAARALAAGRHHAYGDPTGGFIVVPADPLPAVTPSSPPVAPADPAPSSALTRILALLPKLSPRERAHLARQL